MRISPDMRIAIVGAPSYFRRRKPPVTPHDFADYVCINLRYAANSGFAVWELK